MSWTSDHEYRAFSTAAPRRDLSLAPAGQWSLDIWDVTDENPEGRWHVETSPDCLRDKAQLRIVFAPFKTPRQSSSAQILELFRILRIPRDVLRPACHNFGSRLDAHGHCSWFQHLFKNIHVRQDPGKLPEVDNRAASPGHPLSTLPQADYSWIKSCFFLRRYEDGSTILVCFAAPPQVARRIDLFTDTGSWGDVQANPYVLFDMVLEGLFLQVDEMVWNMAAVCGPLEHSILELAHTQDFAKLNSQLSFAALHNCAKHIIHLTEGLEGCVMVVDAVLLNCDGASGDLGRQDSFPLTDVNSRVHVQQQLRECLRHRRFLFRSTQLRLSSLQKRTDNTITLAFNVVTQKDSMEMTRDSRVMKTIAAITIVFLPTTGVASVVGSQLLTSNWHDDSKTWTIMATPLFWLTWWIAIPLTVCVVVLALTWQWWVNADRPQVRGRLLLQRPVEWANLLRQRK
ncbi:hypothetical protein CDD83_6458 [Cordyceps sp. RAO-2017]|nr:hypothetical protein CDD83_6458 [Cordyceps sp. RAO-2017]